MIVLDESPVPPGGDGIVSATADYSDVTLRRLRITAPTALASVSSYSLVLNGGAGCGERHVCARRHGRPGRCQSFSIWIGNDIVGSANGTEHFRHLYRLLNDWRRHFHAVGECLACGHDMRSAMMFQSLMCCGRFRSGSSNRYGC